MSLMSVSIQFVLVTPAVAVVPVAVVPVAVVPVAVVLVLLVPVLDPTVAVAVVLVPSLLDGAAEALGIRFELTTSLGTAPLGDSDVASPSSQPQADTASDSAQALSNPARDRLRTNSPRGSTENKRQEELWRLSMV
jgi:hypothetical protein